MMNAHHPQCLSQRRQMTVRYIPQQTVPHGQHVAPQRAPLVHGIEDCKTKAVPVALC